MDERLKQRLVGAAVIVALAAIFIPMILEGPDDDLGPVGSNLPESPDYVVHDRVEPLVLPPPPETEREPDQAVVMEETTEPEAPATQAPTAASEESADAAEPVEPSPTRAPPPKVEAAPETQTADTRQPEVSGWVVQVGSFSKQSNALGLRDRLRDKGYSAFVEEARTDDGMTYRVRVGPEIERTEADRLQTEIAKTFKLKGIVTHYP